MAYRSDLVRSDGTMARRPYVYGAVGSVNSQGSRPGTPRERDSLYSQGGTPRSAGGRSSTLTHSGAPTPTFFAGTAIQPPHSQPSSRPSTPGHFFPQSQSAPPSAFRQSWPRYASDEEPDSSAGSPVAFIRERRPSRLSLTLSMMDDSREVEEAEDRPGAMSRRSPTHSLGGGGGGDVVRSASMSTEVHIPQPSRSTLFVVNGGNDDSKRSGDPPPPG